MHGQAKHLLRHGVAYGQFSGSIGHGGLLIQRNRVMHHSGDAGGFQLFLQRFAVLDPNGVLGVDAGVMGLDIGGGSDASLAEQRVVVFGGLLAQGNFFFKNRQLGQQDGGLDRVQPAVNTHTDVVVTPVLAMAGNLADDFGQFVVTGKNGAAVTVAAQRFAGKETGAGDGAEVAAFAAFVAGAKTLRCVFNHRKAVPGGNGVNGVKVGALAVQADRDDGFGSRGDGGFKQSRVQVVGARVNIDIHRLGAQQGDGFGGGDVSKAGGDDFIAGPNAQRHLGDLQRVGAVGYGDAVFGAGEGGQLFFKLGHFRAKNVLAVGQHALDAGVDLALDAGLLGFKVDEFDHGVGFGLVITGA